MIKYRIPLFLAAFASVVFSFPAFSSEKIVRFIGIELPSVSSEISLDICPDYSSSCTYNGQVLVGMIDDYIAFPFGENNIIIQSRSATSGAEINYSFLLNIGSEILLSKWQVDTPCRSEYGLSEDVVEPKPIISTSSATSTIKIQSPNTTLTVNCADSAVVTPQRSLTLNLNVAPAGAEFWINGKKTPFFSGDILSLPKYEGESTITYLFRKENYANCFGIMSTENLKKIDIECKMIPIIAK